MYESVTIRFLATIRFARRERGTTQEEKRKTVSGVPGLSFGAQSTVATPPGDLLDLFPVAMSVRGDADQPRTAIRPVSSMTFSNGGSAWVLKNSSTARRAPSHQP